MFARSLRNFTAEEYLMIEVQSDYKSEFFDGEIYAMAGASYNHVQIAENTFISLRTQLKQKSCHAHMLDLRTKAGSAYTYPDVLVICGEPIFSDRYDTVANPTVLIEVLSDSTEKTDRTIKFEKYKQIETLKEYLLISQNEARFELFRRTDAGWLSDVSTATMQLKSIDCTLTASDVYEKVKFKAP